MDVEHDSGSYQSNKDCLLLGRGQWGLHSSSGVLVLGLLGDDVVHVLEKRGEREGGQDAPCRPPSLSASQRGLRGGETMSTATAVLSFSPTIQFLVAYSSSSWHCCATAFVCPACARDF